MEKLGPKAPKAMSENVGQLERSVMYYLTKNYLTKNSFTESFKYYSFSLKNSFLLLVFYREISTFYFIFL